MMAPAEFLPTLHSDNQQRRCDGRRAAITSSGLFSINTNAEHSTRFCVAEFRRKHATIVRQGPECPARIAAMEPLSSEFLWLLIIYIESQNSLHPRLRLPLAADLSVPGNS